ATAPAPPAHTPAAPRAPPTEFGHPAPPTVRESRTGARLRTPSSPGMDGTPRPPSGHSLTINEGPSPHTTATFTRLTTGYDSQDTRNTDRDGREKPWHVASTVSLLRDGDTIVVGPSMVEDRKLILDPLATAGISPEQVTDVVFGLSISSKAISTT
ncbi:hypothetical protein ACTWQR_54940, partial [Streptomyces sp. 2A115]